MSATTAAGAVAGVPRVRVVAWSLLALYVVSTATGLILTGTSDHVQDLQLSLRNGAIVGVVALTSMLMGVLIATRQPQNPIGWLFCAASLLFAVQTFAYGYARAALDPSPGGLPGGPAAALLGNLTFEPMFLVLTEVMLLFPTGHHLSPRWRIVSRAVIAGTIAATIVAILSAGEITGFPTTTNPFGVSEGLTSALIWIVGVPAVIAVFGSLVAAAVSLFIRLRRAASDEREQVKWFLSAGAILAAGLGLLIFSPNATAEAIANALLLLGWASITVASAIAIFKYHLYDIDVVINKTVVFGALAAFITAVYVAIVVGIGAAIGTRGEPNVGLSILATAVVAVLFQPVRERVQRFANRLVYGERATPYEVLSSFASNMASTYAGDDLLPRMTEILARGTGAASAEVWVEVGPELHRAAVHPPANGDAPPAELPVPAGAVPEVPGATRSVPVRHRGETLGALAVRKAPGDLLTPAEDKLLVDLAAQAGLVLRNVRLIEDLKASRQRIVAAQDEERRRLERDIHDGAQQRLVGLALAMQVARSNLAPHEAPALATGLDDAREELNRTLAELRDLARGIHPAILTEDGLVAALEALAERSPVPTAVNAGSVGRLSAAAEATSYFVASEALTNVAKYANASRVHIDVGCADGHFRMEVDDDGVGGADPRRGSGLRGLMDRVAALDGHLEIDSPPGRGTRVRMEIPCA